ncbi:hypothetical protein PRIPAC_76227 [Pristionchus pacificus]|uniref:Uncharacterized protein n=1 Tax=Pristionchus pacificus TaxID=54126 RepID=A0A2A6C0G5_PRIPA|nr:hypothetical protein PRIPAC_76227 [Pristionchus pacificus]|eukprot:PDM71665.1 hypothetical protein PRIPAC_38072 [Pristionchus pacificus]
MATTDMSAVFCIECKDFQKGTKHLTVRRVASIVGRRVGEHYGEQLGESIASDIFGDGIAAMLGRIAGGIIESLYGATRGRRGVEAVLPPPQE